MFQNIAQEDKEDIVEEENKKENIKVIIKK